jgi:L-fuconate dehydratase
MTTVTTPAVTVSGPMDDEVVVDLVLDGDGVGGRATRRLPGSPASAELLATATRLVARQVAGLALDDLRSGMGAVTRRLGAVPELAPLGDGALGQLARAVVGDALWDLLARSAEQPLWKLLVDLPPAQLVDHVDLSGLGDVLGPSAATRLLEPRAPGKSGREADLRRDGVAASLSLDPPGAGGHDAGRPHGLLHEGPAAAAERAGAAVAEGWRAVNLTLPPAEEPAEVARRAEAVRGAVGNGVQLTVAPALPWSPEGALPRLAALAPSRPAWVADPVPAGDVEALRGLRQASPEVPVAAGRGIGDLMQIKGMVAGRAVDIFHLDVSRLGISGGLVALLLAARANVGVYVDGGIADLRDHVAHLAFVDYVAVGATRDRRTVAVGPDAARAASPGRLHAPATPGLTAPLPTATS